VAFLVDQQKTFFAGMTMPKLANRQINRDQTNEAGIERACERLRQRLTSELHYNPNLYGSVAVTVQVNDGIIDRSITTIGDTEKNERLTA
jgi:hypothetical protein